MRTRFALWLLLMSLVGYAAWQGYTRPGAVQTDLLALLPTTETNPRAEEAALALARSGERRSLFLIAAPTRAQARAAARIFHDRLAASGAYAALRFQLPALAFKPLIATLLPYRSGLLSEADRAALAAGQTQVFSERLNKRLFSPLATGLATPLAQDPYATLAAWLETRPWTQGGLRMDEGLLGTERDGRHYVFLSGELAGSAFDNERQQAVARAVTDAEADLRAAEPQAELLRLGAVHYGAAARAQAEWEVSVIGLGSGLGIAVLMLLVFRSLWPVFLSYLPVAAGIAAGAAACVAVFGQVHLLTLVFGASLIGVAVDYPLHYFVARLEDGPRWRAGPGLRRILPGIGLGLLASLLGYGGLLFAPFSVLQQIALYSTAGLTAAWLTTVLALPALLTRPCRGSPALLSGPERLLAAAERHLAGARLWLMFGLIALAALPGLLRLSANDDVHLLISPPAELQAQEAQIRTLAGGGAGSQFFLIEGGSPEQVLAREEALRARLDALKAQGALADYSALSRFVPSPERQAQNRALADPLYEPAGLQALAELGFTPAALDSLAAEARTPGAPLSLTTWLATPWAEGQRHLWLGEQAGAYASIVLPTHFRSVAELAEAARLPGVSFVDKAGSVSRLFTRYRENASLLVSLAFSAVLILLIWRYGLRRGLLALAPSLTAVACALAVLGYAGLPLTLFNIIALMLVLGIGIDYAIFMLEGGEHEAATLLAVSLSALTTILSFGLLALSQTPALRTFGLSVLVGIAVAHTLTPLIRSRRSTNP